MRKQPTLEISLLFLSAARIFSERMFRTPPAPRQGNQQPLTSLILIADMKKQGIFSSFSFDLRAHFN